MGLPARFAIIRYDEEKIILKDLGPWDIYFTITNDADDVVKKMYHRAQGRRLFYYDSEGELTELIYDVDFGKFLGFKVVKESDLK